MESNLIMNDVSRCDNHRCPIRVYCSRYRQIEIDFKNYKEANNITGSIPIADKVFSTIPVSKFNGDKKDGLCDYFINIEDV